MTVAKETSNPISMEFFTLCSAIMNFSRTLKKRDLFSWKQSSSNQNLHAFAVAGVIKTSSEVMLRCKN
jgi:hypothetical protein